MQDIFSQDLFACFFSLEISPQEIFSEITHNPLKTSCHSTLIFIGFAIASISSGSPFLKSCVTLLYSNVLAGQSPTLSTIKPIKIMPSEYCTRIMHESYACGLKTSISRIKDNFSRLTHKSGQIVLNTWWLWVLFCVLTKSYQSTLKVLSFKHRAQRSYL